MYRTSGTPLYYTYNLLNFTKSSIISVSDANDYRGAIDTKGEWMLVEINLAGAPLINLAPGKDIFAIKTGSAGVYDINIDNIKIE